MDFLNTSTSQPNSHIESNPFVYSSPNYEAHIDDKSSENNLLYENFRETQRALMEQKKKVEEEKKLRYPVLSFPNFVQDNNNNNNNNNQSLLNPYQPPSENNNLITIETREEKVEHNDSKLIDQKLITFMSLVEKRLDSLERNLQHLMSDFYSANNNQNKFNEEFLKAISSVSNDISAAKSVVNIPSPPSPSLVVSPIMQMQSGLGASLVNPPQPQGFQLPDFNDLNKRAQEDTDSEIAKRLQEEFDKQQQQQQRQAQPPVQSPSFAAVPQNEPKEDCPVCGASFPVKALQIHVESHFQQPSNPNPATSPSSIPSPPLNQSQLPNSPTKQQGFLSKLFGGKKDENPQQGVQPMMQSPPQQQYFQPIPGYYPGNPQVVRPQGVPQPQVYRLPPGQIPPQGSIVYRPPPNVYPQNTQFINPDGTLSYAIPQQQPPK